MHERGELPFNAEHIRQTWANHPYKEVTEIAARDAVRHVQAIIRDNLDARAHRHCDTCACEPDPAVGWSVDDAKRFLLIPTERVWRAGGGW